MAVPVPMLALSPTMTEGTIATWKIKEGDEVKRGAVLCEVETDKAVMDYEAGSQGTLLKIVAPAGSSVKVGDLIAVIGTQGEDISAILNQAASQSTAPAADGNPASPLPGPQVPKAPQAAQPQAAQPQAAKPQAAQPQAAAPFLPGGVAPSSPLARKLAQQAGIDLRSLTGSGPGGRIVKRDIIRYLESPASRSDALFGADSHTQNRASYGAQTAEARTLPVSRLRQTIARRLGESMRDAPHFYLRMAIDMEHLINLRTSYNQARKDGFTISLNAIFMKLTAMALAKHPQVNSSWLGDRIQIHAQVDMALAVALEDGLVAPVVRDCAHKGIEEIERELRDLIARAKEGSLKPEDYEGATFTISNLGAWGVEEFTAIINPPGSAILALGAIKKEVVVHTDSQGQDSMVIRPMMRATLSSDHRTIDGAVAAAFMKDLAAIWEDPAKALF
ncbi:dihydrolipoamide acetyltransferase family protein [Gracilinema caldarium]|uniref:Dihydrolipoamide acetyltransferase component of pyruvate dehydrogenase complex n=1 Tax=Gracilinema caldarium (strain ATCC 51460 / DSM 7334 / H1) TaxID=744872 RepID=F8F204_GRAC1|nr:dihydrolipoamide acetyltransferase family protein [Gracilinema caldarium]AEJ19851.1 Dihydrolipoyllysine-residue acetyltransferase [Gracilinema caldarium DSM 7334]